MIVIFKDTYSELYITKKKKAQNKMYAKKKFKKLQKDRKNKMKKIRKKMRNNMIKKPGKYQCPLKRGMGNSVICIITKGV